jgi:transcription antitermination factor NusG
MSSFAPAWFAVAVRPQHEKAVAGALRARGIEQYLPLYRARRRWSDRWKELDLPLFAGYVFVRFAPAGRREVLTTPGLVAIVGFGGRPAEILPEQIAAVRRLSDSGLRLEPWPFLKTGQRVRIERGPLAGLEGVLVRVKAPWRLIVSVDLLERSVAAEVDREAVAPAAPERAFLVPALC